MNLRELILKKIDEKESIKVSEIVKETGFSRSYVHRFFKELRDEIDDTHGNSQIRK